MGDLRAFVRDNETVLHDFKGVGMKGRLVLLVVFAISISLACTNSAFAQGGATAAQLNGTITDASGGSVAGAAITLRNTDTNVTSTATSSDRGFYFITNL